jgi:hypothetical protein
MDEPMPSAVAEVAELPGVDVWATEVFVLGVRRVVWNIRLTCASRAWLAERIGVRPHMVEQAIGALIIKGLPLWQGETVKRSEGKPA